MKNDGMAGWPRLAPTEAGSAETALDFQSCKSGSLTSPLAFLTALTPRNHGGSEQLPVFWERRSATRQGADLLRFLSLDLLFLLVLLPPLRILVK